MMKVFLKVLLFFAVLLSFLAISGFVYMKTAPQFGAVATVEQREEYKKTGYYKNGQFLNIEEFDLGVNLSNISDILRKMLKSNPRISPKSNIEVLKVDPNKIKENEITWLGHSSFLLKLNGRNILLDPVFSSFVAPHKWLGRPRFSKEMPFALKDLKKIDFVLISHDHYDHLDYDSVQVIKKRVRKFLVPLAVGNHLRKWGIEDNRIIEFKWWDEKRIGGVDFVFTPTKHMSGRRFDTMKSTLWGSWVIQDDDINLYFSGDGGYGSHFKQIGEKYGPFDLSLIECGQYDELWKHVHLTPEEGVRAGIELKSKSIMPIHWAAFILANHDWDDPVKRMRKESKRLKIPMVSPEIGETIKLDNLPEKESLWWKKY